MEALFLAAQIMGGMLFIAECIANVQKSSNKILLYSAAAKVFETLQFLFLHAVTGAMLGVFKFGRYILFYWFHKNNKTVPKAILIALALLVCLIGILTWGGYLSLLVILATLLSLFATWQGIARNIRVAFFVSNILLAVYAFAVMAYAGAITHVFQSVLLALSFYKYDVKRATCPVQPASQITPLGEDRFG